MQTPPIQTLITDAQQVLNLKSLSEIRATTAAALASANVGDPLNPALTTQQLWDEFYEIVRQTPTDIESIITQQLMKFLYFPPAPGGLSGDQEVIFNAGGFLTGDPGLKYNQATNALTITGDLTVDTNVLKVDTTLNRVSVNTTTFATDSAFAVKTTAGKFDIRAAGSLSVKLNSDQSMLYNVPTGNSHLFQINDSDAMTLNSIGLNVGNAPNANNRAWAFQGFGYINGVDGNGIEYRNSGTGNSGYITNDLDRLNFNFLSGVFVSQGNIRVASGNGIDFSLTGQPAGMTSELLNDYEEGTFTATLKGATTDPTIAVTATGRYTKIGRQVAVQVYFSNVVTTGASGRIGISGLPFANNGSTETVGAVGLYDIATFTGSPFAQVGFNATQVDLYSSVSNSVYQPVTHNAGTGRYLWFNMTYTV